MSKKVYANKTESAASVIGKVLNAVDDDVILYIPRGAAFVKTRNNFLLLKREARAAGKNVSVESVDDDVLELAVTAGLTATNPFLGKKQKAVSDIISVKIPGSQEEVHASIVDDARLKEEEIPINKKRIRKIFQKVKRKKDEFSMDNVFDLPDEEPEELKKPVTRSLRPGRGKSEREEKRLGLSPVKRLLVWSGGAVIIGGAVTFAILVLPRVTISLDFEKTEWDFVGSLNVGTSIRENSFSDDTVRLRGISFSEKKNITRTFPATESDFIERKAKGTITVFNAFSEESQELVEQTRFWTPDGKEYKTDKSIVIPGATTVDGEIVPSSIDVPVTAKEPGDEFNIGPIPRFRIPGFQGSPKYDGFYGESKGSMTGGFVGETKVPTDEDFSAARLAIAGDIEDAAKTQLFLNLPDDTKVIVGTYEFSITDENIDYGASDSDNFSITVFGEAKVIVFREDELVEVFESRVEEDAEADLVVKDYTIDYGEPRTNEEGIVSVAINVESVWTRPFDVDKFRSEAAGRDETELKTLIFAVPGVSSGEVRLWPFWVNTVPDKDNRIIIDVK